MQTYDTQPSRHGEDREEDYTVSADAEKNEERLSETLME